MSTQVKLSKLDIEALPNFKQKTKKECSAACPQCHGVDRFLFWPDTGNYYCRRCDIKGFILEADQHLMSQEQREAWKRAEEARRNKEAGEKLLAVERLQKIAGKVSLYHSQVEQAMTYWNLQGLTTGTVKQYQLGYCPNCPVEPESPSYTIPYFQAGKLVHLRHRLKTPNGHGKYRPEFAGLGNQLFNADVLTAKEEVCFSEIEPGEVLVVEGEVKAMCLSQLGFPSVGLPGATSWQEDWGKLFEGVRKVYVALDPGAEAQAWRVGVGLKEWGLASVVVCTLMQKPDDMFVKWGASVSDFLAILGQGRVVR
jgi:hypothetical protein